LSVTVLAGRTRAIAAAIRGGLRKHEDEAPTLPTSVIRRLRSSVAELDGFHDEQHCADDEVAA